MPCQDHLLTLAPHLLPVQDAAQEGSTVAQLIEHWHVLVIGPERFEDYDFLVERLDRLLARKRHDPGVLVILIHGDRPGTDRLVEEYAIDRGYTHLKVFRDTAAVLLGLDGLADAEAFRRSELLRGANAVVALDDERDQAVAAVIGMARARGLQLRVIPIPPSEPARG